MAKSLNAGSEDEKKKLLEEIEDIEDQIKELSEQKKTAYKIGDIKKYLHLDSLISTLTLQKERNQQLILKIEQTAPEVNVVSSPKININNDWDSPVADSSKQQESEKYTSAINRLTSYITKADRMNLKEEEMAFKASKAEYDASREKKKEEKEKENADKKSLRLQYRETKQRLKGLVTDNKITRGAGLIIDIFTDIIKISLLFLIVAIIIFIVLLVLYSQYASKCVQFRTPEKIGREAFLSDITKWQFFKCLIRNAWLPVDSLLMKLHIKTSIIDLLDQQIARATGDYYYYSVDQNSKEPVGLFIENIETEPTYDVDWPISISANIRVKTVGNEILGSISCDIDDRLYDSLYPPNGKFLVDKTTTFPVGCLFDKYRFSPGNKVLTFYAQYNFETFAYMVPSFVRRSIYRDLTETQKSQLLKSAEKRILKTTNSPVKIGGEIGGTEDEKLVIISDYDRMYKNYNYASDDKAIKGIKFGITIHAKNWDEGKIKEIKDFIIVLPEKLKLTSDLGNRDVAYDKNQQTEINACGGYTFKIIPCSDELSGVSSLTDLKNNLPKNQPKPIEAQSIAKMTCKNGEVMYYLDQSGQNNKLRNIENFKTLKCWLEAESADDLFTVDGNNLGVVAYGIKVYASYEYVVSKKIPITLIKNSPPKEVKLKTSICSDSLISEFNTTKPESIYFVSTSSLIAYAKQYQPIVIKYAHQDLPDGFEPVKMQAMIASLLEKIGALKLDEFNEKSLLQDSKDFISEETNYIKEKTVTIFDKEKPNKLFKGIGNIDYDNDGTIDYVTGCRYSKENYEQNMDDVDAEIKCTQRELASFLRNSGNDPIQALKSYYSYFNEKTKPESIYPEDRQATEKEYYSWLRALCLQTTRDLKLSDINKTKNSELTENQNNNDNKKVKKINGETCSIPEDCISGVCIANKCSPCEENNDLYKCQSGLICRNSICINPEAT